MLETPTVTIGFNIVTDPDIGCVPECVIDIGAAADIPCVAGIFDTLTDGVPEIPTVVWGLEIVIFGMLETPTVTMGFNIVTAPEIGWVPECIIDNGADAEIP